MHLIETGAETRPILLGNPTLGDLKEAAQEMLDDMNDAPFSGHLLEQADLLLTHLFDDQAKFLEHRRFWGDVGVHLGIPATTDSMKLREMLSSDTHRAAIHILRGPDDCDGGEAMEMFIDPAQEFLEAITLTKI